MKNILNLSVDNAQPLTPKLEIIKSVSNRLFVALFCLLAFSIVGALLLYDEKYVTGATSIMVLLVGFIGGFVGLQRRLKTLSDSDLHLLAQSWVYTVLSPMVGGILAMLVYILFISGLLEGDLFPRFLEDNLELSKGGADLADNLTANKGGENVADNSTPSGLSTIFYIHAVGYKDYAKLIVWCFIAGYSERFVTDIISHFESVGVGSEKE